MERKPRIAALVVGIVLLVWTITWTSNSSSTDRAYAQEGYDSGAPAMSSPFYCPSIYDIAVWENRIHFRCNSGNEGVLYYAYATDPSHLGTASQMLAIGNSAFVLDQAVYFYYNTDPKLNPPGCMEWDCRGLVGLKVPQ